MSSAGSKFSFIENKAIPFQLSIVGSPNTYIISRSEVLTLYIGHILAVLKCPSLNVGL